MFIKNIIISGFRSYREQSFPDGLSPATNIIVGRNGSGKSNFFAAVQFVLDEKFANLRTVERKELFHVGAGRPALSIFVEIVFDNADGRVVIPGRASESEVRIRRTVGLRQDEFHVNDRKFTAAEVRQLMESAGFSTSNPYYVVEQGKIISLASMSDEDRYALIKEVAGTKVYETRRAESERILEESRAKRQRIDQSIVELGQRIADLEVEANELKEFDGIEKRRRAIEYCIHTVEVESAMEELRVLEGDWEKRVRAINSDRDADADLERTLATLSATSQSLSRRLSQLEQTRQGIEKEKAALISRREVAKLNAQEAQGQVETLRSERAALEAEEQKLSISIKEMEATLTAKGNALRRRREAAAEEAKQLRESQLQLAALEAKRGQQRTFKNKQERDKWIDTEIRQSKLTIYENEKDAEELSRQLRETAASIHQAEQDVEKLDAAAVVAKDSLHASEAKRAELLQSRNTLNATRRRLWQDVNTEEAALAKLSDERERASRQLERTIRHDIRQGIQSLQEALTEMNDAGLRKAVYGRLIDLFTVEAGFENAVEVVAGNAIFSVVVDTFRAGARLLEHINRSKKPGRVTFLPLDTCLPQSNDTVLSPEHLQAGHSVLLTHMSFDPKFRPVLAELFGRVVVVASMEDAAKVSRQARCDVVTLDGEQFSRKGAITGGFYDRKTLRLVSLREIKLLAGKIEKKEATTSRLREQVTTVGQQITNVLNQLEVIEADTKKLDQGVMQELYAAKDRISRLRAQQEHLELARKAIVVRTESTEATIRQLAEERQSDFHSSLTVGEEARLNELVDKVRELELRATTADAEVMQMGTDVQVLEESLRHLQRRKGDVVERIHMLPAQPISGASKSAKWAESASLPRDEHHLLDEEVAFAQKRLDMIDKSIDSATREMQLAEEKAQELRGRKSQATQRIQREKDRMDSVHNDRALLIQRKEDAQAKMQRLGAIAPQVVAEYSGYSVGKLMHLLRDVNVSLAKFAHVNRKAADQYAALVGTRDSLEQQRDALEKDLSGIHDLMAHLDQKKGQAIERTYKQIQFHFEEVFKELVRVEDAQAKMQLVEAPLAATEEAARAPGGAEGSKSRAKVRPSRTAVENADRLARRDEDPFCAARIEVSFGHGTSITQLEQLSGGQKSLVALAFIFAIQRCDPAPFYLFDEIDAALDSEYRVAVAQMLARQSTQCQFIVATFKTEMLEAADRVLGIFFHNKVSSIQTISREEGLQLLKQVAHEDRKRGRESERVDEA